MGRRPDWLSCGEAQPFLLQYCIILMKSNLSVVWSRFVENLWIWLALRNGEIDRSRACGKSRVGFFQGTENHSEIQKPLFNAYSHQGLKILQGNFFDLNLEVEDSFQAVFDRASLVAIPEELRPDYVQGLTDLMSPGSRLLLICVDYDPLKMSGPPYSVSQIELENLFQKKEL